ncbi:MAG: SpoIID/LytB domain-containing protein [Clostridiales bacterium]|nr:SpoIID/LytB domain-containing protein [Clostridiales bacterium]
MKRLLYRIVVLSLVFCLALGGAGGVFAAGNVYVNDSQNTLTGDVNSAYVIGGSGETGLAGDSYAITGSGVLKVGESVIPSVPDPGEEGTSVSLSTNTVRVGLYYYYSGSRDTALTSANLENKVGSGYKFGYYDSNRVFHETGSTTETKITMSPKGDGRGVSVAKTGTSTVLYEHTNQSANLAVRPVSSSGKAETWFKGNTYYGDFEYYRYVSSKLTVINVLDIEDYVKGVVPIEMSPSWPIEALKAQALCARTYFARSINSYSKYGFDVTADTYCQAYLGTARATANSDAAVDATAGKYVTYKGELCTTFYFSSGGGATESSENIFVAALPYCRGKLDPYEEALESFPYKTWKYEFKTSQLLSKLKSYGLADIASFEPTYSPTGNMIELVFTDSNGKKATITKSSCYSTLGLPSINYTIKRSDTNPDLYIFEGGGWGHSVGMSQWGAYSMAKNFGMNYRQIISFYFTGVDISTGRLK